MKHFISYLEAAIQNKEWRLVPNGISCDDLHFSNNTVFWNGYPVSVSEETLVKLSNLRDVLLTDAGKAFEARFASKIVSRMYQVGRIKLTNKIVVMPSNFDLRRLTEEEAEILDRVFEAGSQLVNVALVGMEKKGQKGWEPTARLAVSLPSHRQDLVEDLKSSFSGDQYDVSKVVDLDTEIERLSKIF